MAAIKTKMQGDSMSIGIAFNAEYDTTRIENHYLYLNNKLYPTTIVNGIIRAELTSEQTKGFIGNVKLLVVIDDIHFGVRKTEAGYITFLTTPTIYDQSINEGYDVVVSMNVSESETTATVEVLEAFRGLSAYDIYVKYTTDDPILTESEWNTAVNAAKESAEDSEAAALISEQNAKASELAAEGFKNTASQQATISTDKALESFNSAAAALVSEQHAKTSEDNAKDSETASGISANNAAGSAITAGQQAGIATNKASEALGYRNEAEGFKTTAGQQATIATNKAGEALQSAQNASNSAQDALDYKNTAEQIVSAYFIYNITVAIPLVGNYYTLTTAIAATPVNVRKLGLVITFADTATTWLSYKFIGSNVSGWGTLSNWERVIHERELVPDELVISEAFNALLKRIEDLEAVIKNAVFENIQVNNLTTVKAINYNGAPLILTGTAAPSVTPDFIGQFFINTTGGTTYQAKGTANAADWKQTA